MIRIAAVLFFISMISSPIQAKDERWAKIDKPHQGKTESIGGYANGCIIGATALPPEGVGYQVIRLSRNRYYGHPELIDYLIQLGKKVEHNALGVMLVADMNQPAGGPMPKGHSSHQSGLDVDIWLPLDYPHIKGKRDHIKPVSFADYDRMILDRNKWTKRQAKLIKLAVSDNRVARIFVNPAIKEELCKTTKGDRGWLRKVRPWWKHHTHFHVRLKCPKDSKNCKNQPPPPAGEGCGKELYSWWPENRKKAPKKGYKKKKKILPLRCRALLENS